MKPPRLRGQVVSAMLATLVACATRSAVAAPAPDARVPGETPQVVLIGTTADDALVGRLGAELRALGIDVDRRVVAPDDAGVDLLVEAAMHDGARAVVRVQAPAGRIEVSIADPATHALALREVLEGAPTAASGPVLAVRSVEFVRAMLLGTPPPETGVVTSVPGPEPPPSEPSLPGEPPILGLTVASGVAVAAGGLGAQAEIGGEIRVGLGHHLGLEILGLAPLTTEAVPGPAPNARATVWLAGGGLYARGVEGRVGAVEVGAGALAVALRVAGGSDPSFAGGAKMGIGTAAYGRVGGALTLTRALAARADLLVGSAIGRPVAYAGGPGYPWGFAFATALVGLEARWF